MLLHNFEAEQALLGAIMTRNEILYEVRDLVAAEDFSDALHGRVFTAAAKLIDAGNLANPITLKPIMADEPALQGDKIAYLVQLANSVVTLLHCDGFARAIRDLAIRRRLQQEADEIAGKVLDPDVTAQEQIAAGLERLQRLVAEEAPAPSKRSSATDVVVHLSSPLPCYSTGLPMLDAALGGGLFAGKTYGYSARMKVGKTVLAGTISHNLNRQGVKHLFLAFEMSPQEIEMRNMARDLGVNSIRFLKPQRDQWLAQQAAHYAINTPDHTIYEAAAGATLTDMQRVVSTALLRHGIRGVILDYLQLVSGRQIGENEEQHTRSVAQWLANFCRRHGLWSLIAAQANQSDNVRGGEGLRLACDAYLELHRPIQKDGAWMVMRNSRYTAYEDVGSEAAPGLYLMHNGPWFRDATMDDEVPMRAPSLGGAPKLL